MTGHPFALATRLNAHARWAARECGKLEARVETDARAPSWLQESRTSRAWALYREAHAYKHLCWCPREFPRLVEEGCEWARLCLVFGLCSLPGLLSVALLVWIHTMLRSL